jgi:hypothetical protein
MRRLIAGLVALGGLGSAAILLSACAGQTSGAGTGASSPAPVKTVTVAPITVAPVAPKPAAPKPKPKPKPRTVTRTVVAPAPAPPQSDPWAVVSEYYGDVSSHDYWDAWNLLGPGFQASEGSYDSFVAGYAGTGGQTVREISEYGDQVTYQLESYNPDGTVQMYQGTATVYDGKMQHTNVHQTYGSHHA